MSAASVPARVARACRTYTAYLALGHTLREGPGGRVVRAPDAPQIYDANHVQRVTAASAAEVEALLGFAERELDGLEHRSVVADPSTPPGLLARLALEGYVPRATLQLVLEGPLRGAPPPADVALRLVEAPPDHASLRRLLREDHVEDCARLGRAVYAETVTDQMLATKRAKPALRFWLASVAGEDAGFFSSWPGEDGMGMVEDLFTLPRFRRRGVARALIHHAVADARARGAREVLIGADPTDTPMQLYARLGFEPTCLTWSWLWTPKTAKP